MRVDLNLARESLLISLEANDEVSVKDVQSELRAAKVPFVTLDSQGVWQVSSRDVLILDQAVQRFHPMWAVQAERRLALVQEDARIQKGIPLFNPSDAISPLTTVGDLLRTPYDEQFESATYMSSAAVRRFALFWKPGTGKTGALICAAHELLETGIVNGVLVVAERPTAVEEPWQSELNSWIPPASLGPGKVARIQGNKRQRLETYLTDPTWLLLHYGLLVADLPAIIDWANRKQSIERPIVIFDESDLIKNPMAARSRAAMSVRQSCGRCWLASGTPAPNSPADYEHQMSVLCGYPVGLGLSGDPNQDALVVIHELERGVYYLQQDNPRKMPETIWPVAIPLTSTQRDLYDRTANELINDLSSMDDRTYGREFSSLMAKRAQLFRVCSDPAHESLGDLDFSDPAKATKLDELLEEILSDPDEKAVIWTRFRDTARNLFNRYETRWGATLLIGGGEGRPQDLNDETCRVLIATIQVGASSISLTASRNAIYESLDDVSRNFSQSMARINRTGQTKDCRYWVLISEATLEEDQFQRTMGKINLSEEILEEIGDPGRAQLIEQLKRTLGTVA